MQVRTPRDIGALIRDRRKHRKLDQAALADMIGVNRRWIVEVERGKARAEVGLILKALHALGLAVAIDEDDAPLKADTDDLALVDIDAVVRDAKASRP